MRRSIAISPKNSSECKPRAFAFEVGGKLLFAAVSAPASADPQLQLIVLAAAIFHPAAVSIACVQFFPNGFLDSVVPGQFLVFLLREFETVTGVFRLAAACNCDADRSKLAFALQTPEIRLHTLVAAGVDGVQSVPVSSPPIELTCGLPRKQLDRVPESVAPSPQQGCNRSAARKML